MSAKSIDLSLRLDTNTIIMRTNEEAKNLPKKSYYIVNADYYNVFIRDGKNLGMPLPYGGILYPHSKNCTSAPSLFSPRYKTFSVMVIPKDFLLKFCWDVELTFRSPVSGKSFTVYVPLSLYPSVDDLEIPENMEIFMNVYETLRAIRGTSDLGRRTDGDWEQYTVDDWKELIGGRITEAFKAHICEYINEHSGSFRDASSLRDIDTLPLIDSLYESFDHTFRIYGLMLPKDHFYSFFERCLSSVFEMIFKTCQAER